MIPMEAGIMECVPFEQIPRMAFPEDIPTVVLSGAICLAPSAVCDARYGNAEGTWTEIPTVPTMPKVDMRRGFENFGASSVRSDPTRPRHVAALRDQAVKQKPPVRFYGSL